uniref:Uncharacterized protein n=1 Tax=Cereibacter sphaeroides (strain ATCC 17025 / ATH 2.4.3) TaxID=349102 RepID=A4WNQ4_CERS5
MADLLALNPEAPCQPAPTVRRCARIKREVVEVVARAVPVEPVPIISIDSDHLPPPFRAPWCERRPFAMSINSAEFGEDDPERLRCSGSQAVGRAMVGMAEGVQLSPHRDVREIAQLVLQWFAEDAGRYEETWARPSACARTADRASVTGCGWRSATRRSAPSGGFPHTTRYRLAKPQQRSGGTSSAT